MVYLSEADRTMKTLKQQLQENIPVLASFIDKDVEKAIIRTVREWLEQKRQDLQQFEYETILNKSEKKLIDSWIQQELLEEFKP